MNRQEQTSAVQETAIPIGRITLQGTLGLPARPAGTALFAHGSGSGRSAHAAGTSRRSGSGRGSPPSASTC